MPHYNMLIFALFYTGGVLNFNCQIRGEPKPLLEWILPDGSKVRAPYSSDDRRIVIYADGKLTLRSADISDTGMYRCIATNYLDADILVFRLTVLSPDVEEEEVNGVQLSKPMGGNQVLDCSSSGSPKGSIQWILPDHSLLDMSDGNKKLHENGTLEINGLAARDRGFYRCVAANHLGVDLLVSQLTLTEEETGADSEGSGITDLISIENAIILDETSSSSPYHRSTPRSQTFPLEPPVSSHRSQGRGGAGRTQGQRRGLFINRRPWSRRVFDKSSRRVEQQTFAEFMKRAQKGSGVNFGTISNVDDDNETGSAVDLNEDHLIIATDSLLGVAIFANKHQTIPTTTETENKKTSTVQMYMQPNLDESDALSSLQETQIQLTAQPAEPETSTWGAVSITTDPYVTLMSDSAGTRDVVHTTTGSERQILLAAITTTESQQDEIILHTTQTLKSPHLLAGSTIISQQQIHIIPHKNDRSGGHRKIFHSRRRIIKPSRITDVQSFLNQLKQSSNKKDTGTTEASTITTTENPVQKMTLSAINYETTSNNIYSTKDLSPEVFGGQITPAAETTPGQFSNKNKKPIISTTAITSTTASKIIRGKIPWIKLFGNKTRESIFGRVKKPFISKKLYTPTTAITPTITTMPTNVFTTATIPLNAVHEKDTLRNMGRKEGSSDDDYEGLSSSDSESTTLRPSINQISTTTPLYHSPCTTAETPPRLQIFPSPPTVTTPSTKNNVFFSGSGGRPDTIIRQRPGWKGQKRKNIQGRRPFNRHETKLHPSKTTKPFATGIKMETTTPQHWIYSSYDLLNKPTDVNLYEKTHWSSWNSTVAYTTMKRPLISSTTLNPTTTTLKSTPHRSKVDNAKTTTWSRNAQTRRPQVKGVKPTVMSSYSQVGRDTTTMTSLTLEQKYTSTPATFNNINTYSNFHDHDPANGIKVTSPITQDSEVITRLMSNKPKITGGNAASYTVLSHSNAYLPCEAVGNPQPTINWRRLSSGKGMYAIYIYK